MTDENASAPGDEQYWYNTKTGQVEQGRTSVWENRMGPYKTRAEAENALATARKNTAEWDSEDSWENEE